MSGPSISVIIPAYNAERYLRECITSVLDQSASGIECIVVDDGSTDGTGDVARSFGDAVLYIYQENAERSAARNNGLRHARGEFVSFLDADDYIAPDKISEQLEFLQNHPEYDVVYSKVRFFEEGKESFKSPKRITPSGDILEQLLYGNFITMHSPLIRRSAIDRSGGFDPELSHNEDWEFLLRLSLSGAHFGFLDEFNAYCRLHPDNTSRDALRMFQSKFRVCERFVSSHSKELAARNIDYRPIISYHKADYGKALILNGSVAEGRQLILDACREPIPQRRALLLLSYLAGLVGSDVLRKIDSVLHEFRKWRK